MPTRTMVARILHATPSLETFSVAASRVQLEQATHFGLKELGLLTSESPRLAEGAWPALEELRLWLDAEPGPSQPSFDALLHRRAAPALQRLHLGGAGAVPVAMRLLSSSLVQQLTELTLALPMNRDQALRFAAEAERLQRVSTVMLCPLGNAPDPAHPYLAAVEDALHGSTDIAEAVDLVERCRSAALGAHEEQSTSQRYLEQGIGTALWTVPRSAVSGSLEAMFALMALTFAPQERMREWFVRAIAHHKWKVDGLLEPCEPTSSEEWTSTIRLLAEQRPVDEAHLHANRVFALENSIHETWLFAELPSSYALLTVSVH